MNKLLEQINQAIIDGEMSSVTTLVQTALDEKVEPKAIMNTMTDSMSEVGRLFEEGEFFVPEMLVSARAMQNGLDILNPVMVADDITSKGMIVIGTVKGDLHDIGKNLVTILLKGAGYDVIDLGSDVQPESFVEAIKNNNCQVVALSALLTTTMINMKNVIEAISSSGLQVKVIVGGAPVTQEFANQIGADGYAADANKAVKLVDQLLV